MVTGATGFLGSRLSELLVIQEKADVAGIGRKLGRVSYLKEKGVKLRSVDILNTKALKEIVKGKEIIFHTAAVLDADPATAQAVNVDATEQLVQFAAQSGATRLVHVSTVGVYDMKGRKEIDESTPLVTDHPATYPRTKAQAEKRAFRMAEKYGLEISIVRPSMIYGPGHGIWSEGMFQNIMDGNPVFLGDGSSHFNPVYIDDVVNAITLCAKHPEAAGEAFNISAGVTTWREFMDYYAHLTGKNPRGLPLIIARLMAWANKIPGVMTPIDQGFIEMASSNKHFPIDKAKNFLGWKPDVTLEEGMERTTDWLEKEFFPKN